MSTPELIDETEALRLENAILKVQLAQEAYKVAFARVCAKYGLDPSKDGINMDTRIINRAAQEPSKDVSNTEGS